MNWFAQFKSRDVHSVIKPYQKFNTIFYYFKYQIELIRYLVLVHNQNSISIKFNRFIELYTCLIQSPLKLYFDYFLCDF